MTAREAQMATEIEQIEPDGPRMFYSNSSLLRESIFTDIRARDPRYWTVMQKQLLKEHALRPSSEMHGLPKKGNRSCATWWNTSGASAFIYPGAPCRLCCL